MKVLFVDHFDSFTYNLVDEFARRGADVHVVRSDIVLDEWVAAREGEFDLIVLSPGPGAPESSVRTKELVDSLGGRVPIFGVCLGHQILVEVFGGTVGRAEAIVHGKAARIEHDGRGVFSGCPNPMAVARYHSLAATNLSDAFDVTARIGDLVMAIRHRSLDIVGVQFHPESVLTPEGPLILDNVIEWARACGLSTVELAHHEGESHA
jgi:anthranilate synthase component II